MSSNVIEITARLKRDTESRSPERTITRHCAPDIMFDGVIVEADAMGRVLSANISYGEVYIYIEERVDAAMKVRLHFKGYRSGECVPPGAQYVASVYEHSRHWHIYLVARAPVDG